MVSTDVDSRGRDTERHLFAVFAGSWVLPGLAITGGRMISTNTVHEKIYM